MRLLNTEYDTEEVRLGLKKHGLPSDKPSQIADTFRLGYSFAKQTLMPEVIEKVAGLVEMQVGGKFSPEVMATVIRAQLEYGDYFKDYLK